MAEPTFQDLPPSPDTTHALTTQRIHHKGHQNSIGSRFNRSIRRTSETLKDLLSVRPGFSTIVTADDPKITSGSCCGSPQSNEAVVKHPERAVLGLLEGRSAHLTGTIVFNELFISPGSASVSRDYAVDPLPHRGSPFLSERQSRNLMTLSNRRVTLRLRAERDGNRQDTLTGRDSDRGTLDCKNDRLFGIFGENT